jgi:hypothetical protein
MGIFSQGKNVEVRNGSICTTPSWALVGVQGTGFRAVDVRATDTQGIAAFARGALVERCQVTNTRGVGITLGGQGGVARNCQVAEAKDFEGTQGTGIKISTLSRVVGCSVSYASHAGIRADAYNSIEENTVYMSNMNDNTGIGGILLTGGKNMVRQNYVQLTRGAGICCRVYTNGNVLAENSVFESVKIGGAEGFGISCGGDSVVLRGNLGTFNAGAFISGSYQDGGGNLGD